MAVFSYNLSGMQTLTKDLQTERVALQEAITVCKANVQAAKAELASAQSAAATAKTYTYDDDGDGVVDRVDNSEVVAAQRRVQSAQAAVVAAELALKEAEQDITELDAVITEIQQMTQSVQQVEEDVTIAITSELLNLENFPNDVASNIANYVSKNAEVVSSGFMYVKSAKGEKVYLDVYADEDLSLKQYADLTKTLGAEGVIRLMTAQGKPIEMIYAAMGTARADIEHDDVKKISQQTECYREGSGQADALNVLSSHKDHVFMLDGVIQPQEKANVVFNSEDYLKNTGEWDAASGLTMKYDKTTYTAVNEVGWDKKSYQAGVLFDETTYVDENGLYRTQKTPGVKSDDDYYCVAMGYKFMGDDLATDGLDQATSAGYTYQVAVTNEAGQTKYIDVILADAKGDSDSYVPHDHPIEFEINSNYIKNSVTTGGNVDFGKLLFGGGSASVTSIGTYNKHLFEGNYKIGYSRT